VRRGRLPLSPAIAALAAAATGAVLALHCAIDPLGAALIGVAFGVTLQALSWSSVRARKRGASQGGQSDRRRTKNGLDRQERRSTALNTPSGSQSRRQCGRPDTEPGK
jgi:hypothetical protein